MATAIDPAPWAIDWSVPRPDGDRVAASPLPPPPESPLDTFRRWLRDAYDAVVGALSGLLI
jgi:hypothetical protein